MALSASLSSAGPSTDALGSGELLPASQAGPLPRKRGEIGFQVGLHDQVPEPAQNIAPLPARHPEERATAPSTSSGNINAPPPAASAPQDTTSIHTAGKRSILSKGPVVQGVHLTTLLRCLAQSMLLCGTITGWVLVVMLISKRNTERKHKGGQEPAFDSVIFIHIAFALATIGQILFLERGIYHLRAERYVFLHPDATALPSHLRRGLGSNPSLAFAPWNRPPLPTYAAALAESGVGTGDVEDGLIAVQPPPAYGKTRGSTMLLSGFMNDRLREQAREARAKSDGDNASIESRPVSYISRDEEWEERADAERARRLEETLARLEVTGRRTPAQ